MGKQSGSKGKHAIVIGGSISGLFAARVLADFFAEVTIIERDSLTYDGQPRRGVPQDRHAHGLLAGGTIVLEHFFPGIIDDLQAAGAETSDVLKDVRWFFEGGCLCQTESDTTGVLVSRPVLEAVIRKRVRLTTGIKIVGDIAVRDLVFDGDRVAGVRTDENRILPADLVVDATGRGSRSPQWLTSMGLRAPREEKVEVQLAYTTRRFKRLPGDLGGDTVAVIAPTPKGKRGGVMGAQENGTWIVTLFGHFGNQAPADLEGFIEYAKRLPAPYIYDVIRNAEPVDDATSIRFPASTRRRFEKLRQFPKGFLVFGDAICSFNPIYGQGMSSAALQAEALRDELASGSANLASRFFKKAAKVIDNPWNIAVGSDLRMPETIGPRSPGVSLINWYIAKLHKCAHHDPKAAMAFIRVAQLLEKPETLMRPSMVLRVLSADLRKRLGMIDAMAAQQITSS